MNLLGCSLAARRSRGALLAISVAAVVLLSGCLDSSSSNNSNKSEDRLLVGTSLDPDGSDLVVRASGDGSHFFRLARSNMQYVARYKESAPGTREWEKGLADDTSSDDPNPHDLIFVNADRAYLLMMDEHQHWEVNPSATAPSLFREVGRLDLSAYGMGGDGAPAKAHAGVVVDDLLFVSMQRWYWDGSATQYAQPYVAVFDVSDPNAEEIDTGGTGSPSAGDDCSSQPSGDVNGIALSVCNPLSLVYDPFNERVWLAGNGGYAFPKQVGGVQWIGWEESSDGTFTFTTDVLFRDGDEGRDHGESLQVEIVAEDRAYLIGSSGWQDDRLYAFNPQTGVFEENGDGTLKVIAGLSGLSLPAVARGPQGRIWVAVADDENPRVVVIDPSDHSVVETITGFELNPNNFAFTQNKAVVSTVAPDFSSGAHAVVDLSSLPAPNGD